MADLSRDGAAAVNLRDLKGPPRKSHEFTLHIKA
jgi:hypothetical protein